MSINEEINSTYKDIFFHISNGSYLTKHSHNGYFEFMFVEKGNVTHTIDNKQEILKEGSLTLLRPDDYHLIKASSIDSRIMLGVRSEYLEKYLNIYDVNLYNSIFNADKPISIMLSEEKYNEIIKIENIILLAGPDERYKSLQLLFTSFIEEIIFLDIKTIKNNYQYSKPINTLLQLISDSNNLSLSMPDLIRKTVYSYSHINRLFLKEVGVTLSDYLRDKRINHAKNLLINTDRPLKEISSSVGYNNYSNFSIFFKTKVGKTPAEYRIDNNKKLS